MTTQDNPKRDVRLKRNNYTVHLGIDIPYSDIEQILQPQGISKLYSLRELFNNKILLVDTQWRPNHTMNKLGVIHEHLIKYVDINIFDIQKTEDGKCLIQVTFTVSHWSRLKGVDTIALRAHLIDFFENKIPPQSILIL